MRKANGQIIRNRGPKVKTWGKTHRLCAERRKVAYRGPTKPKAVEIKRGTYVR